MIAKYNVGNGFRGAINYDVQKESAEVVIVNNLATDFNEKGRIIDPHSLSKQMRENSNERKRVQLPVLHVSFSFNPNEKLTEKQGKEAVVRALDNVGINANDFQYVVTKHNDTAHPHYHVVVNRVDLSGQLHNDHKLADRFQVSCDRVEKEMNLQRTKGRNVIDDPTNDKGYRYLTKEEKAQRGEKKHRPNKVEALASMEEYIKTTYYDVKENAKGKEDLEKKLIEKGISVNIKTNKNGIYGLSFQYNDKGSGRTISIKASKLGIKANKLNAAFEKNIKKPFDREKFIAQSIHSYKGIHNTLKSERRDYSEMVAEQKKSLINYGKGNPYDVSQNYSLDREPFLGDLRANKKAFEDINEQFPKLREIKVKEYQDLMNTPEKKVGWIGGSENKTYNQELKQARENKKSEIVYMDENKNYIVENELDKRVLAIESNRIKQMSEELEVNRKAIIDECADKGIDLKQEIFLREKAKRDQEREKNISQNKGGFSR